MALAFSNNSLLIPGRQTRGQRVVMSEITLDTDYPDGGYALTAANFGFSTAIKKVYPLNAAGATGADSTIYDGVWDKTASKLRVHVAATGVEAADGLDGLTGLVLQVLAVGY